MKLSVLLIFLLANLFQAISFSQTTDFSYDIDIQVEINERGNGTYSAELNNQTKATCSSEDFQTPKQFTFPEGFFSPLDKIKIRSKYGTYYKSDLPFFYPDMQDVFISDSKTYYYTSPNNIKKGEVIQFDYTYELNDVGFFPIIELENSGKYSKVKYTVYHPDDINVRFEVFSPFGNIKYTIVEEDDDETRLELDNIKKQDKLSYFQFNHVLAYIHISLDKNVSLNNIHPGEFVNWYSKLTSLYPKLDVKDIGVAREEILKQDNELSKLKVIYDYVRNNFRYLAEVQDKNSIIPRDPSVVLDKGYADCKERAALVSAIAKEYGIKVNMAVVTREDAPLLKGIFVNKFNHVICSYNDDGNTLFFDPTAKYCEFGNLPEGDIGREALILDELKPRVEIIPEPKQKPSLELLVKISADSLNSGFAEVILRNDFISAFNHAKNELSSDDYENLFSGIILSQLYKISLEHFQIIDENESEIKFRAKADLSQYFINSKSKKFITKTPFIFFSRDILERKKDNFNIYLKSRVNFKLVIELSNVKGDIETDSLVISTKDKSICFNADSKKVSDNMVRLSYRIIQHKKFFDQRNKIELLDFCEVYLNNKSNMFMLKGD